jgi:hypothetical protein
VWGDVGETRPWLLQALYAQWLLLKPCLLGCTVAQGSRSFKQPHVFHAAAMWKKCLCAVHELSPATHLDKTYSAMLVPRGPQSTHLPPSLPNRAPSDPASQRPHMRPV